jgi:uncharacterized protein YjbI with pentapeptide repeats
MERNNLKDVLQSHEQWLQTAGKKGKQAYFENQDLQELYLEDVNLSSAIFIKCNLNRSRIKNVNLTNCYFSDSSFLFSICHNVDFSYSSISKMSFDGAVLNDCLFENSRVSFSSFYKSDLYLGSFNFSSFYHSNFDYASLIGSKFLSIELDSTNFYRANITKANIYVDKVKSADFDTAQGVPSSLDIVDEDQISLNEGIVKILNKSSKLLLLSALSIVIVMSSMGAADIFKMFTLNSGESLSGINYLAWSFFSLLLFLIGVYSNFLSDKFRKADDRLLKKDQKIKKVKNV